MRILHSLGEANLVAICDCDDVRLDQMRSNYPYVRTTSEVGELLGQDLDAVVVSTPVSSHYHLTKEALLNDKHVLVEKPMTTTFRDALELIELAQARGKVLMTGHTFLYHPAVNFLRQLVMSGELGEIYYIDSARLNLGLIRPDVNVVWDLAPHDASILLYLLDETPVSVSARGMGHLDPSVCDVAYLELAFPSETLAHIHVSWLDPCKVRRMTVVGSKKMAVYNDVSDEEKIRIYDKGVALLDKDGRFSAWPPSYRYGDVTIPFISNDEPLQLECIDFLHSTLGGTRPRSDGWAGLEVVRILEMAITSLVGGGEWQRLPPVANPTCAGTRSLHLSGAAQP